MNFRENQENLEIDRLSVFATKSKLSKGRDIFENPCELRTDFQRDRDRIIHSKAFRRLKHKTQVFISPQGDHYRTRLTHTLEVAQIARTIARALLLNEDLTEAIALGHDLGHTPFGHAGESALNSVFREGFEHCDQSLRIVEKLEKDGAGLNLTWEVRDGILNHRTKGTPKTLEGKIVRLADKIAYINHDIDDAIRAGILCASSIPKELTEIVGTSSSTRINSMIKDTVKNSNNTNDIVMSPLMAEILKDLRKFMFQNVYNDNRAIEESKKVEKMLKDLFFYFLEKPNEMEEEFIELINKGDSVDRVVCDFIACMTDRYSIAKHRELFIPSSWNIY